MIHRSYHLVQGRSIGDDFVFERRSEDRRKKNVEIVVRVPRSLVPDMERPVRSILVTLTLNPTEGK